MSSLRFDIEKVVELKRCYEENMRFILSQMPQEIDWTKRKQVKWYLQNKFDIVLENGTISHIQSHLDRFHSDSEEFEILYGYLAYLRLYYACNNYLCCILNHHIDGLVELRLVGEHWLFPNKRPVPSSPDILACLDAQGEENGSCSRESVSTAREEGLPAD